MAAKASNQTRLSRLVVPTLEKIIKNASWRKHSKLVQECKVVIEWFAKRPAPRLDGPKALPSPAPKASVPSEPSQKSEAETPALTKESLPEVASSNGATDHTVPEESEPLDPPTPTPKEEDASGNDSEAPESTRTPLEIPPRPPAPTPTTFFGTPLASPSSNADGGDVDGGEENAVPVLYDDSHGGLSIKDTEFILHPLHSACETLSPKVVEPALDCFQKMVAHGHLRGEMDQGSSLVESRPLLKIIDSVCKCYDTGDESVELLVLKTLLSAVTSTSLRVHGECLLKSVRTCYNVFLGSKVPVNQTTAKASLTQMLVIVFRRMEADSSTVPVQPIVVADLMEPAERSTSDQNVTQFVQGFITRVVQDIEVVFATPGTPRATHDGAFETGGGEIRDSDKEMLGDNDADMVDAKYWEISVYKNVIDKKSAPLLMMTDAETDKEADFEVQISNKLRRDAFLVFRALCKLSMKNPPAEGVLDPFAVRGKIVALELLKIMLENAGSVFRTSERFVVAIKQYLCLSLLKNCASSLMSVFQLSCSIFMSLVARFRAVLKPEIGVFFPMIVLRVLENVAHANYLQKMIVLRFLEKLSVDPQVLVDVFVNYDCDVESSNIFERMVNGLLKTAQGIPPGSDSALNPAQDAQLRLAAVKCLVGVLRSMCNWTNRQMRLNDSASALLKGGEGEEGSQEVVEGGGEESVVDGMEGKVEGGALEATEAATFEQRRAYKLELQEGLSLFNKKPLKGIAFLIKAGKLGTTPEEIASFLRNGQGLDKSMIGDYLGDRDENAMKVMHCYVDSFNFKASEFDEAIRAFLNGFRLPGEAQKIDRIMEKFAERYCRCNTQAFTSADTAYVLAYSVIMLNTDAHNPGVKNKMSKAEFVKNNRGIDDGKDLPEEFMSGLYDRISRHEIKMKADSLALNQQALAAAKSTSSLMGLDSILNLVGGRVRAAAATETSDEVIKAMQEQFKRAGKAGSVYYEASDVDIVRPMVEVVWAPMLAGFSVPLDKSEEEAVTFQCLEGFRHAIHLTAVMCMQMQRDAFLTSLAKFTSLHSAADIKQKNIDAIKCIIAIADEEGNYLQEAWEHILTCVSRFEHLHLIGEGAPPDATFFAAQGGEGEKAKPPVRQPSLRRKVHVERLARRGSYDSTGVGGQGTGVVTSEQMSNLVSNLHLLEQIGSFELSKLFTRSDRLNSEAIVEFVKALCKVSLEELRSPTDPRVFSLTKIVEICHFNMSRIRLVWSRMWAVLAEYFVTVGTMENLSVAMYAMDSLRQLAMKFLEREELSNYNFQNEFLKPFVIVMRRSGSVEIRELIIRCVSQMVFARVANVKSGWKIMFMVFTHAATDDHKNIVLLAFETIEKIVREYFPFITETETTTFTDCVNCLIAFTNSRFNTDVSLNAIAFLRFCALKLAEGELGESAVDKDGMAVVRELQPGAPDGATFTDKDDHLYFWFPLLAGLSELTFDPRPDIRKSALEVLFDTLRFHGHMFSPALWERVFDSVLFPIFDYVRRASEPQRPLHRSNGGTAGGGRAVASGLEKEQAELEMDAWLYETCTLALQLVVDLFVKFYGVVSPLLGRILHLLTSFIQRPHQSLAAIGVAAFVRLMSNAGELFSDEKWEEVLTALKEAAVSTLPDLAGVVQAAEEEDEEEEEERAKGVKGVKGEEGEDEVGEEEWGSVGPASLQHATADVRCKIAVQLLLVQAMTETYSMHAARLSSRHAHLLLDTLHSVASHAHTVNSDRILRFRLQELRMSTQMPDPPLLRLESEAFHAYLSLLQRLPGDKPKLAKVVVVELRLVELCQEVLQVYVATAAGGLSPLDGPSDDAQINHWAMPLGSARRRELVARAPLVVATLRAVWGLEDRAFKEHLGRFFPLLAELVSCEHGSAEVQVALSGMFSTRIGPILLQALMKG